MAEAPPPETRAPDEAREPLRLVPKAVPEPGTLGGRAPPLFNVALFVLTAVSLIFSGLMLSGALVDDAEPLPLLPRALAFAAALLGIMLAHEMGHFLLARRHRVDASWPYFIPAPLISPIGTMGAVIKLRELPKTRRALIDIGAAGPLAGFLVTLPVLALGLHLSKLVPEVAEPGSWTLFEHLLHFLRTGSGLETGAGLDLGEPLAMQLLERLVLGRLPAEQAIELHPLAIAGWFGLLLTALNLLPLGQLDGGHLLYAVSPRLHRLLGPPLSALLLGLGIFTPFTGWAFWGLLTGLWLSHHPPLQQPEPALTAGRKAILALSLVALALSFCVAPVSLLLR